MRHVTTFHPVLPNNFEPKGWPTILTIIYFILQWKAYGFSSMFILDVATKSQKDHKLFSATYILCS